LEEKADKEKDKTWYNLPWSRPRDQETWSGIALERAGAGGLGGTHSGCHSRFLLGLWLSLHLGH